MGRNSSHNFLAGSAIVGCGVPLWGVECHCGDIVPLLGCSTIFGLECYSRCGTVWVQWHSGGRVALFGCSGTLGVECHFRGKVSQ